MKFGIFLWSVYSLLALYVSSSPLLVVDNDVDDESSGITVITLKGIIFLPSMIFVFHSFGFHILTLNHSQRVVPFTIQSKLESISIILTQQIAP